MKTSYVYQFVNLLSALALLVLVLARLDPGIYLQWVLFQTLTGALIQVEQSLNTVVTRAISRAHSLAGGAGLVTELTRSRRAYLRLSLVGGAATLLLGYLYLSQANGGRFGDRWLLEWVLYCLGFAAYYSTTHHACALVALGQPERFAGIALLVRWASV